MLERLYWNTNHELDTSPAHCHICLPKLVSICYKFSITRILGNQKGLLYISKIHVQFFFSVHATSTDNANVKVIACKNAQTVSTKDKATLKTNGFTKCAEPFGILIAGTKKITNKSVLAMAKIVAELLDQNKDGKI